jgi:SAM-dependent methyltransferase
MKSQYALSVGKRDEERLAILNEVYNPTSVLFFKQAGIQEGMSVLDVGCGTGIMSCEIGKIVGPAGKVTCLDISAEQLDIAREKAEKEKLSNLAFQCLPAQDIGRLQEKFDAVCCRFLLMHLKDPLAIIDQFLTILSPGGLLIAEESMGVQSVQSLTPIPAFDLFYKIAEAQYRTQESNSSIGALLPQILTEKGMRLKKTELFHPVLKTSREKSLLRLGLESIAPRLKEYGITDEQQLMRDVAVEIENNEQALIRYHALHRIAALKS